MATITIKTVTLSCGTTFELPYADLLPGLPADEFAALVEDIRQNGVVVPVHATMANEVIDGQHRLLACESLKIPASQIPIDWCTLDDAKAERWRAISLNIHRRQLDRETRANMVRALRMDGLSYAAIADQLGVGESTVRRDACSTPSDGGVEQIIGKDGKARAGTASTPAEIAERRQLVAALAAQGLSMRAIAEQLEISLGTVAGDFQAGAQALAAAEKARAELEEIEAERQRWQEERAIKAAEWKAQRKEEDAKRKEADAERKRLSEELGLKTVEVSEGVWDVIDGNGETRGRIEGSEWSYHARIFLEDGGRTVEYTLWARWHATHSKIECALECFEDAIRNPDQAKAKALREGKYALPAGAILPGEEDDDDEYDDGDDELSEEDVPAAPADNPDTDDTEPTRPHPFNDIPLAKGAWERGDLRTGTWWDIGHRWRGDGRSAAYHGNFVPQIPDQAMRRYTKQGDVVVDLFLGGATTVLEALRLGRHCIAVDLQEDVVAAAWALFERQPNPLDIDVAFESLDAGDSRTVTWIKRQLKLLGREHADHVILHPPYWKIIEFSQDPRCLSQAPSVDAFLAAFAAVARNAATVLAEGRFLTCVVGDISSPEGGICPLGFLCMSELQRAGLTLWATNVKDMQGNQRAEREENLWTWRALNSGLQIFKHEYVFVFRKSKDVGCTQDDSSQSL